MRRTHISSSIARYGLSPAITVLILAAAGEAWGEPTVRDSVKSALNAHCAVFEGKVLSVRIQSSRFRFHMDFSEQGRCGNTSGERPRSQAGADTASARDAMNLKWVPVDTPADSVTIHVTRAWKGPRSGATLGLVTPTAWHVPFEPGKRYLVYASCDSDGTLMAWSESRTKPAREARFDVRELRLLAQRGRP
jgi:hypothetical protein